MSFYNARGGGIYPGVIEGNALTGMRHRVAVSIERVLDSCLKQETAEHTKLRISKISPSDPTPPLKFQSAFSVQTPAAVSEISIARLAERPEFARIKCIVTIPMRVTFEDSKGKKFTAESELAVPEDVILYVPKTSIFPFEVKAAASVNCAEGKPSGENAFSVTACYTIITKITAPTDLLIPAYGFCPTPHAVDFSKEESSEFFDLPLYPSGR